MGIMEAAQRAEVIQGQRQMRVGCDRLNMIDAGLAGVADGDMADHAAEMVAAQGQEAQGFPCGRVVEPVSAARLRLGCQRSGRIYQASAGRIA